jgi:type II secretory pathway pseudopilin PulG
VKRTAFTLVEMLVAVIVASMLTAGVLAAVAGIARDRQRLARIDAAAPVSPHVIDLLRRDLTNATAIVPSPESLILEGHGGIDPQSLAANNRFARVTYRIRHAAGRSDLVREQRYLDDAVRPEPWAEWVAAGVTHVTVSPGPSPSQVTLRIETTAGA